MGFITPAILLVTLLLGSQHIEAAPSPNQTQTSIEVQDASCNTDIFNTIFRSYNGLASVNEATSSGDTCSYTINVRPTNSANTFHFRLVLPERAKWNRRFLTVGNAGFLGAIITDDVNTGVYRNFATMGTDTGHPEVPEQLNLTWALNADKRIDWAYRAMNDSITLAKPMVVAYYNDTPIYKSYYSSCSTGGRQGLMQITINPKSFDGVLVGAPSWDLKHSMSYVAMIHHVNKNAGTGSLIAPQDFVAIDNFVLKKCGKNGVVEDASACNFTINWNDIIGTGQGFLNKQQVDTVKMLTKDSNFLTGINNTDTGVPLFPGFQVTSAYQWYTYLQTFRAPYADWETDYMLYFMDLGRVSWGNFTDREKIMKKVQEKDLVTVDADLIPNYGGKIIMYHGTADGTIPTRASQNLYNLTKHNHNDVDKWFRYFEIPGLQHCFQECNSYHPLNNLQAPWYFGGSGQANMSAFSPVALGINDTRHDALLALVDWVEGQVAPANITLTAFKQKQGTQCEVVNEISRQRPVCPYPTLPQYHGGDADGNLPENQGKWTC